MPEIPETADDVTVDWLESAFARGSAPLTRRLLRIDQEPIAAGTGVLGELTRLHLTFGEGPEPPSVILKLPSQFPPNRARASLFRLYEREVRFYQDVALEIGVRIPKCYWADWDGPSERSVLLLEDLGHLEARNQITGIHVDDAILAVEAIGRMHALWWESPRLESLEWLPSLDGAVMSQLIRIYRDMWPLFIDAWGDSLPRGSIELGETVRDSFSDLLEQASASPVTIVHGDFRVDNLFFPRDPHRDQLAILDWQLACRGRGAFDVAYLLCQSMTFDARRRHEMAIVRHWHETLLRNGVTGYSLNDAISDYRLCALLSLGWIVAGAELDRANERGRALAETQAVRSFTAAVDLYTSIMV